MVTMRGITSEAAFPHPAHSCSRPLGNQTRLQENTKPLTSLTLFFQWEVYTVTGEQPAGGHGEYSVSRLIQL